MNKTEICVSVIVPVYNVESYLEQCLESITSQSLKNIEIIIIDDGSTDSSPRIIKKHLENDHRIIAITKKNGGYGSAINCGLSKASGKYISIIESDDWIEPEMLEMLFSAAEKSSLKIAKSGFTKVHPNQRRIHVSLSDIEQDEKCITDPLTTPGMMLFESSIWSAIYHRKSLIEKKIKMEETPGASYQDVIWKFATYSEMGKIKLIDKPLYNYRVLAIGSSSSNKNNFEAHFKNYETIKRILESNSKWEKLKQQYYIHQFLDFVFHTNRLSKESREKFIERASHIIAEAKNNKINPYDIAINKTINKYYKNKALPLIFEIERKKSFKDNKITTAARLLCTEYIYKAIAKKNLLIERIRNAYCNNS